MDSKVSSDWLPSYIKATRPILEIFKMTGYFPDSPCIICKLSLCFHWLERRMRPRVILDTVVSVLEDRDFHILQVLGLSFWSGHAPS